MSGPVFGVRHVLSLPLPPVRREEVLRYAGVRGNPGSEIIGLMEACIRESESIRTAHFLYVPVPVSQGTVEFQGQKYSGKTLERTLKDSRAALVFAATLGFDMDQLIRRYARTHVSRAHMFQALGAERIESFLDALNADQLPGLPENTFPGPRCSPGYGDLPLDMQRDLFAFLGCDRYLGLTLSPSLLITPSKTVTGLIALTDCPVALKSSCTECAHPCAFRKPEVNI